MIDILKKMAKSLNPLHIKEKKFDGNFLPPKIRFDVKWHLGHDDGNGGISNMEDEPESHDEYEGESQVEMIGTHYKELTASEVFEITNWDPVGKFVINTGDAKLDNLISNKIVDGFIDIADEFKMESGFNHIHGIIMMCDADGDNKWSINLRDMFEFDAQEYIDKNMDRWVSLAVFAEIMENDPKAKKNIDKDDDDSLGIN